MKCPSCGQRADFIYRTGCRAPGCPGFLVEPVNVPLRIQPPPLLERVFRSPRK